MKVNRSNLFSLVGLALVIYLGVLVFGIVKKNYELSRQIDTLSQRIDQLTNDKLELAYKVQYFMTDSFKEKEARAKFGLMAPGEGVIILPKQAASSGQNSNQPAKPKGSNFHQWWSFLFG